MGWGLISTTLRTNPAHGRSLVKLWGSNYKVWKLFEEVEAFISTSDYVTYNLKITLALIVDIFHYLAEVNEVFRIRQTICELKVSVFSFCSKLQNFLMTAWSSPIGVS